MYKYNARDLIYSDVLVQVHLPCVYLSTAVHFVLILVLCTAAVELLRRVTSANIEELERQMYMYVRVW